MAEFVGTLALAAESYLWRQYTWFGAEKCNYTGTGLASVEEQQQNSENSTLALVLIILFHPLGRHRISGALKTGYNLVTRVLDTFN